MLPTTKTSEPQVHAERSDRHMTQLYRRIRLILNGGFVLSIGLILAGIVVAVVRGVSIGPEADPLPDILPGVARLDPQGIVDLGILILLATPVAYVVVALVTFARHRDLVFTGVCIVLLLIVAASVGMALL